MGEVRTRTWFLEREVGFSTLIFISFPKALVPLCVGVQHQAVCASGDTP
jgi:hypothetical protein